MDLIFTESGKRDRYYLFIFTLAIISFGISAWINIGYLHFDEHYQILEFANYKRGLGNIHHLPWEFAARLRPAIQPVLAYVLLELMNSLTIDDPYHQSFILRNISGLFSIYCIYRLFQSLKNTIRSPLICIFFLAFSFLFYRLPYVGVRFSSENWSTCFLISGLSILIGCINNSKVPFNVRIAFLIGILFGFSFLFRYQSAILLAGLALWAIVFRYRDMQSWFVMFLGFAAIVILGILIDRWYYDEWVFTAWNYFRVNLMEGKASEFGTEPWWWYMKTLFGSGGSQLIDGSVLLLVIFFMIAEFKNLITWILLPFLIIHFLIPHKELRFISPLFYFVPYMTAVSLDKIYGILRYKRVLGFAILIIAAINGLALTAIILKAPDTSMEIYKYLRTAGEKPMLIYHDSGLFSYTLSNKKGSISPDFYKAGRKFQIKDKLVNNGFLETFIALPVNRDTLQYLILSDVNEQQKVNGRLKIVFDPDHNWIQKLNYHNWMRRGYTNWKLYEKDK